MCTTLGGVDWLVLDQEEDRQRLVTFGRDPAVEVTIRRGEQIDFQAIVDKISASIQSGLQPATGQCTDRVEFPRADHPRELRSQRRRPASMSSVMRSP